MEDIYGMDHLETAKAVNLLATIYKGQEKYKKAVSFFNIALEHIEKSSSSDYARIVFILKNKAKCYKNQGNYEQLAEVKKIKEYTSLIKSLHTKTTKKRCK
jgi:tetratricopeptide (TPR) repeat protein